MSNPKFYLWLTVLTEAYVDPIIATLVKRGYSVAPLASTGNVTLKTEASALISLEVIADNTRTKDKAADQTKFLDEVKTVLGELKVLYHSVIVSQVGGSCTWNAGNITLPKEKKQEPTRFDKVGAEDKPAA